MSDIIGFAGMTMPALLILCAAILIFHRIRRPDVLETMFAAIPGVFAGTVLAVILGKEIGWIYAIPISMFGAALAFLMAPWYLAILELVTPVLPSWSHESLAEVACDDSELAE